MNRKKELLYKLLGVVFSLMFVVSVFSLIAKNLWQPLTKADIEQCTLIASDIYYNQKDVLIYDVPENYKVKINDNAITVIPTDNRYGSVNFRMQNGKLVSDYDDELWAYCVVCGVLTIVAYILLLLFVILVCKITFKVCDIINKKKKSQSENATA